MGYECIILLLLIDCCCFSSGENRKILHEQEAEKMLITLLGHDDPQVQVACAQALAVMSDHILSKDSIGQWGEDTLQLKYEYSVFLCKFDIMYL